MTEAPEATGPTGNRPTAELIRSLDDLDAWCRRSGIRLVSLSPSLHLEELVAADVPVWITVDCWASDEKEEAFGIKHATRVIRRTTLIPFAQKPLALPRAASGCC